MKKRMLAWVFGILAVLLIAAAVGAWMLFGAFITAANSIEKLEDGLYAMEYRGDYGLDEFLERGGAADEKALADFLTSYLSHGFYKADSEVETGDFGCSTICVTGSSGETLFGRNYDWERCRAVIVHTLPKNGYESVSTCCLDFLGFDEDYSRRIDDGSDADAGGNLRSAGRYER